MSPNALFNRTEMLVGAPALRRLQDTSVILFGVGGVGSWCAETLVRTGIGKLAIVDSDAVCITNINRQVEATTETLGRVKVDVLGERLLAINPALKLQTFHLPFTLATQPQFKIREYDYVLDAIDSLSFKMGLILHALEEGVTLYSSLGASAKLDPTRIRVDSLWRSHGCPLGKRIRKRLRHHGIRADFKVVYSDEMRTNQGEAQGCGTGDCLCPKEVTLTDGSREAAHEWCSKKASINGSLMQVTATFGLFLASLVINDVIAKAGPLPPERGERQLSEEEN